MVLPYPPTVNGMYRRRGARTFLADAHRDFRAAAMAYGAAQRDAMGARPLTGAVTLAVDAFRPAKRGDIDNVLKALLDALQGVAYENDAQVVEILIRRWDDASAPRVVVNVCPADPARTPQPATLIHARDVMRAAESIRGSDT